MDQVVMLNGQWVSLHDARISVEDRGFMFADGVYEVIQYYNRRPIAMQFHLDRLLASLSALRIQLPDYQIPLEQISGELIERNSLSNASVYWQVTRGVAPRNHLFPSPPVPPTVLVMAYPTRPFVADAPVAMFKAITHPDERWARCAIKSIALLPNVLAKQAAADAGCDEAILVRDGHVTEGTARTILIVEGQTLVTHPLDGTILPSVTRKILLELAREGGLEVMETLITPSRLMNADEVMAIGTTTQVAAVVNVDGQPISDGQVGPVTNQLAKAYRTFIARECRMDS